MGKKIKRLAKNKTIALVSLGGFILAVVFRMFFGGSHLNISRLDSKASDVLHKTNFFVNTASADAPGGSFGEGASCGCGEGGEGSGGGG
jgi:hypothetical protein